MQGATAKVCAPEVYYHAMCLRRVADRVIIDVKYGLWRRGEVDGYLCPKEKGEKEADSSTLPIQCIDLKKVLEPSKSARKKWASPTHEH